METWRRSVNVLGADACVDGLLLGRALRLGIVGLLLATGGVI